MRDLATKKKIEQFMRPFGRLAKRETAVYSLAARRPSSKANMIEPEILLSLFKQIETELYKYPSIDPASFAEKVDRIMKNHR